MFIIYPRLYDLRSTTKPILSGYLCNYYRLIICIHLCDRPSIYEKEMLTLNVLQTHLSTSSKI